MVVHYAALIRHGDYHQLKQTPSAWQPFALNEAGVQQALAGAPLVTQMLNEHDWVLDPVIDSSNLLRGWQTATIFSEQLTTPLAIESFDALAERSMGSAANLTVAQVEQILADDPRFDDPPAGWKSNSHYKLPLQGGESLLEAGQRVVDHIKQRMAQLPDEGPSRLKLFVGHGAAFRHAAFYLGVMSMEDIARYSMYHARPVVLQAGPQWRHHCGDWKVRQAHDQPLD
ncbi:histidine phosphatase family protein [Magnetococcus sp. PR-3]|uniref:histidine phosphatase family protein n=1 Tax=Magnetococcus sp. PR-3 TaxID=3120355 RepID=UPI002FCE0225